MSARPRRMCTTGVRYTKWNILKYIYCTMNFLVVKRKILYS
jgi:hypothetical protein